MRFSKTRTSAHEFTDISKAPDGDWYLGRFYRECQRSRVSWLFHNLTESRVLGEGQRLGTLDYAVRKT